jgi:TatD DNase family protein
METSEFIWVDTHCHAYTPEFDEDRDAVIARALAAGITKIMLPNIDMESIPGMMKLTAQYPDVCYPMMGLHPCSVKKGFEEILDRMEEKIEGGGFIGIGETGIDLYWDKSFKNEQIASFERHIEWARRYNLPIIIHSRESLDVTIELITRHQDDRLKGIFHCFSGTPSQVEQIRAVGFKVGIGGVVTFKKAGLAELLPQIPLEMIVLETDSPYLAPMPNRGKRNEPAYVELVAQKVAEVLEIPLQELSALSTRNAEAVYGKKV